MNVKAIQLIVIDWLNANTGLVTAIATVVIALSAIVTVFLTSSLANENRLMRKAGTEPKVVAYLAPDSQRPYAINFVLANVGRGPATKVEFTIEGDMNEFAAHGVSPAFTNQSGGRGTDMLPQGERIQSFFGGGPELLSAQPLQRFSVCLKYEDLNGRRHESTRLMDVAQLDWISWLE